jgi:DNA-binding transcriptional LysR family regulator
MPQENFNDLVAFLTVARERSFTKAAAKLGVSQSALSQTVRSLEERLGIRLLTRTTRSVSPTEAGERLLNNIGPRFEEIEAELGALNDLKDKPSGTIRITAGEHPAISVLAPAIRRLAVEYPDINIEVIVDYGLTDIVAERYDAGIRLGEQVAKDMIAVKVSGEMRMAVVASPDYFKRHGRPETPQDLTSHNCINMRLPTHGGIYPWEFERDGRELRVRVDGRLVFNNLAMRIDAAISGLGVAYLPEDQAAEHVAAKRLERVLEDWCEPFPGYHLYYPNRRHTSPAFAVVVEALRHRG